MLSPTSIVTNVPNPRRTPAMKNQTKLLPSALNKGNTSLRPGKGCPGYNTPYRIMNASTPTILIVQTAVEDAGSVFPCVISGSSVTLSPQIA
tara:strand:- start:61 stop:336 length:276 start_codon:yes stop_codon:yes gene_type:complete